MGSPYNPLDNEIWVELNDTGNILPDLTLCDNVLLYPNSKWLILKYNHVITEGIAPISCYAKQVVYPNSITSLKEFFINFGENWLTNTVWLGKNIQSIGNYGILTNVEFLYIATETPCSDNSFLNWLSQLQKIYVPLNSVGSYKKVWNNKASIIEGYDFTGKYEN